jgi:hypothetical protein
MEIDMTDEVKQEQPKLTLEDPVDPEQVQQLERLRNARAELADESVHLDLRKIQILAALKRVETEQAAIFEALLTERDLPLTTQVVIDSNTGKIEVIEKNPKEQ